MPFQRGSFFQNSLSWLICSWLSIIALKVGITKQVAGGVLSLLLEGLEQGYHSLHQAGKVVFCAD
jgi:hypothetical protein